MTDEPEWAAGSRRLAVLLAMAMFVLVVDTSLLNVSIAKVVEDLDTTVSGVQAGAQKKAYALVGAAAAIAAAVGPLVGGFLTTSSCRGASDSCSRSS